MRVALLTNGIWPYVIGGMQKHSFFLCKYLARQKIEVVLFHTNEQPDMDIHQLEHFSEEEKKYITPVVMPPLKKFPFPGSYVYASYLYSKSINKALQKIGAVDFIIAKSTTAWYTLKKRKGPRVPVAINIHGYEFLQNQANTRSRLESRLLSYPLTYVNKKADYVFSYGGKITDLIKSLGVPNDHIIEIPTGIESAWMAETVPAATGKRKFIFVGRFERRKGIQEIHEVIRNIHGEQDFEFHFIGPIPENQKLNLSGVHYHGVIREKEKLQGLLQAMHVLVCPSYSEGMPNVILEGIANGCAAIATDVGAVNQMIDEKVGWLIPPADIDALQHAVLQAINIDNRQLDVLRNEALVRARDKFTWERIIEKTISAIKQRI
ncbi:MAG: glycosyltransferase family 4 protein [Chitinophagaceae bacterium]|nr:glycosyltransferase family 4 protein [Chitinophagaceae bacterium]